MARRAFDLFVAETISKALEDVDGRLAKMIEGGAMAEPIEIEEIEWRRYEKVVPATNTDKFWDWTITRERGADGIPYYVLQFAWGRRGTQGQLGDKEIGSDLGLLTWKATRKAEVKLAEGYWLSVQRKQDGKETRWPSRSGTVIGVYGVSTGSPTVVGVDMGKGNSVSVTMRGPAGGGGGPKPKPKPPKDEPETPLVRERRVKLPD